MNLCKKCKKILRQKNKSGLCRRCYDNEWNDRKRKKRRKNKCCIECGRNVKKEIGIPYRCKKCTNKIKERREAKKKNE